MEEIILGAHRLIEVVEQRDEGAALEGAGPLLTELALLVDQRRGDRGGDVVPLR
ncbi:hypothetical protein FIU85_08760 [Roseovarius sp. THAF8]|uniref:hypothetical protein n=1 Tax=Roseovarius sp. THAF8 TaxID=2587846 RepID=UPI0012AA1F93|nr:hypothetical protein [Roseovarius sp. THAF8]QFT97390.1 hypothetical protein FIU85_08760 [Roseovarius sp. THAF8]